MSIQEALDSESHLLGRSLVGKFERMQRRRSNFRDLTYLGKERIRNNSPGRQALTDLHQGDIGYIQTPSSAAFAIVKHSSIDGVISAIEGPGADLVLTALMNSIASS
jgi:hypothetical protein